MGGSVEGEDEFSLGEVGVHHGVRFAGFFEGETALYDRAEGAVGQQGPQVRSHCLRDGAFFLDAAGTEGGAGNPQARHQDSPHIDLSLRTPQGCDQDQPAFGLQASQVVPQIGRAHHAEDYVRALAAGRAHEHFRPVLGSIAGAGQGAKLAAEAHLFGSAGGHENARSQGPADLYGGCSDAAGAAVDYKRISCAESARIHEVGPHGKPCLGNGRCLNQADVFGDGQAMGGGGEAIFRIASARNQSAHPVANGRAVHTRAQRLHHARHLESGPFGRALRRGIVPLALHAVGAVHAGGRHLDEHFARARRRTGALFDAQDFRASGLGNRYYTHGMGVFSEKMAGRGAGVRSAVPQVRSIVSPRGSLARAVRIAEDTDMADSTELKRDLVALPGGVRDALGRPLRDLRISVMDRCNFRCPYCMPEDIYDRKFRFLSSSQRLSFSEIIRLARLLVGLGASKLRITGGEPLLRPGLADLVGDLSRLEGVEDIALTTNGVLLAQQAAALAAAGLDRVTVSLDAVDEELFRRMSGGRGRLQSVLEGIAEAQSAGLQPIKINAVIQRGVNDEHVLELVEHFRGSGMILRLIEYMDVGTINNWEVSQTVPAEELVKRIDRVWPLRPLDANYSGEVARRYAFADGQGELGFITSVTQPFCGSCNRARLSSDGRLFTCLFADEGLDLRAPLRAGAGDSTLLERIEACWSARRDRYSELRASLPQRGASRGKVEMYYIGG